MDFKKYVIITYIIFRIYSKIIAITDLNINKRPEHIVAQPSQVKVTHVYNQSVWSDILSSKTTPATKVTQLTGPVNTTVVTDCDIKTLIQVSITVKLSMRYYF